MSIFDYTGLAVHVSEEEGKLQAEWTPPADFPAFNGHFPGNPILPGVAHISLISEILKRAKGDGFVLETVKRVKFLAPILPEKPLSIVVTVSPGEEEGVLCVDAVIRGEEKKISVLKLHYRRAS